MEDKRLLGQSILLAKQDIKNRYLAGESIPSIAGVYGMTPRNAYYHLGLLSPEDKAYHIKNSSLRKMIEKRKETHDKQKSESGTAETTKPSLADFVE
jgi:hypothetical protein